MNKITLCKDLFELSKDMGWPSTDFCYTKRGTEWSRERRKAKNPKRGSVPDYSSDYLLRTLRLFVSVEDDETQWWAKYNYGNTILDSTADTPDMALLKLTIQLFEKKIFVPPPEPNQDKD